MRRPPRGAGQRARAALRLGVEAPACSNARRPPRQGRSATAGAESRGRVVAAALWRRGGLQGGASVPRGVPGVGNGGRDRLSVAAMRRVRLAKEVPPMSRRLAQVAASVLLGTTLFAGAGTGLARAQVPAPGTPPGLQGQDFVD